MRQLGIADMIRFMAEGVFGDEFCAAMPERPWRLVGRMESVGEWMQVSFFFASFFLHLGYHDSLATGGGGDLGVWEISLGTHPQPREEEAED